MTGLAENIEKAQERRFARLLKAAFCVGEDRWGLERLSWNVQHRDFAFFKQPQIGVPELDSVIATVFVAPLAPSHPGAQLRKDRRKISAVRGWAVALPDIELLLLPKQMQPEQNCC
jgi:hypothetical protein